MKALKFIGIGLLGLVVLLAAVGFILPRQVRVERSLVMKAQPRSVYDQINNLRNWEVWSPWHQIDPEMKLTYGAKAEGEGATYNWTSQHDQVGDGKLTILSAKQDQEIVTEMVFGGEMKSLGIYKLEPVAEGTKLTWIMESDMGMNPVYRYMGLMMDDWVGADFERGLANLQAVVEAPISTPATPEVAVK